MSENLTQASNQLRWHPAFPFVQRMAIGLVSLALLFYEGTDVASFGPSPYAHWFMLSVLSLYVAYNGFSFVLRLTGKRFLLDQAVPPSVATWALDFAVLSSGLVFAPESLIYFAPLIVFMSLVLGLQTDSRTLAFTSISGLLFVWLLGLFHPYWSERLVMTEALIFAFALLPFVFFQICQSFELKTRQLEAQLFRDELTGLKNRRALKTELELAFQKGESLTLVFVDLDRFKQVNDSLGHQEGDAVLKRASSAMQRVFSRDDELYRLSGDEFVVFCKGIVPLQRAQTLSDELNESLREITKAKAPEIDFGACLGFAPLYKPNSLSVAELLSQADALMYKAKQKGRSGFAYGSD